MKKIGDFLGKFAQFARNTIVVRETILTILAECGVRGVKEEDITIAGQMVRIKTSATVKNELFLKKGKILTLFKQKPETKNFTNIS